MSNSRVSVDPTTGQTLLDGVPVDINSLPPLDRDEALAGLIDRRDGYLQAASDIEDMRDAARTDYQGMPLEERFAGVIKSGLETLSTMGKAAGNFIDAEVFGGEPIVGTFMGTIEAGVAAQTGDSAKATASGLEAGLGVMDAGPLRSGAKGLLSMEEMARAGAAGDGYGVFSNGAKMFGAAADLIEAEPLARGFEGVSNLVDASKSINEGVEEFNAIGERDEYFANLDESSAERQDQMGDRAADYGQAVRALVGPDVDPRDAPFNFIDSLPGVGQPLAEPPMYSPIDGGGEPLGLVEPMDGGGRYIASVDLPEPVDPSTFGDFGDARMEPGYVSSDGLIAGDFGPTDDSGGVAPSLPGEPSPYFGGDSALPLGDFYAPDPEPVGPALGDYGSADYGAGPELSSTDVAPESVAASGEYGVGPSLSGSADSLGGSLPALDYDVGAGSSSVDYEPAPSYSQPVDSSQMLEPGSYVVPEPPSLAEIAGAGPDVPSVDVPSVDVPSVDVSSVDVSSVDVSGGGDVGGAE